MKTKKTIATTSRMTALMVFHVCFSDWLVLSSVSVSPNTSHPAGLQTIVRIVLMGTHQSSSKIILMDFLSAYHVAQSTKQYK